MIGYPTYKKVLFCTDFSENADYAFEFAYGIVKGDGGLLYVLHVIPENPHRPLVDAFLTSEDIERIQKNLEEDLAKKYEEHYLKKIEDSVKCEIVTKSGREDDEIIKSARQEKADIIVMGTHGRTGIEHAFFGSIAERVVRHSTFSVFIIPCREKLEHLLGRSNASWR
jgi:nucleotide-binding universal stress UspA family protein